MNRLVGVWERQGLDELRQVKVFTASHFFWVVHDRQTGATLAAGGGTYCLDGAALTERYEYSSVPQLIGLEVTLTVVFEGNDTWTQTGTAPLPGISLEETYQRVE
jgi:hypothetical protein